MNFGGPALDEGLHALLEVLRCGRAAAAAGRRGARSPRTSRPGRGASCASSPARRAARSPRSPRRARATSFSSSSAGTTLLTRPSARHSSASSVRPVNAISHAFAQPTSRGSSHVPPLSGSTPRFVKTAASFAPCARDADVAAEREVHAVAGGGAVQRADRRLVHLVQHDRRRGAQVEARDVGADAAAAADALARRRVLQVEPGAEALARAGEDDRRARRGLRRRRRAPSESAASIGAGDRVQAVGAVQRQRGDRAVLRVAELVGHAGLLGSRQSSPAALPQSRPSYYISCNRGMIFGNIRPSWRRPPRA